MKGKKMDGRVYEKLEWALNEAGDRVDKAARMIRLHSKRGNDKKVIEWMKKWDSANEKMRFVRNQLGAGM